MKINVPCANCERAGCGSFHDQCEKFQEFKALIAKKNEEKKSHKRPYIPRRSYRNSEHSPLQCHKK